MLLNPVVWSGIGDISGVNHTHATGDDADNPTIGVSDNWESPPAEKGPSALLYEYTANSMEVKQMAYSLGWWSYSWTKDSIPVASLIEHHQLTELIFLDNTLKFQESAKWIIEVGA